MVKDTGLAMVICLVVFCLLNAFSFFALIVDSVKMSEKICYDKIKFVFGSCLDRIVSNECTLFAG